MIANILSKILSSGILESLIISYLSKAVENPNNKVSTHLAAGVEKALDNKDSGLQRKPTGPRKKK